MTNGVRSRLDASQVDLDVARLVHCILSSRGMSVTTQKGPCWSRVGGDRGNAKRTGVAIIFCGYLAKHLYGLHMAFILAMGACMVSTGRFILSWLRWVGWEASSLLFM